MANGDLFSGRNIINIAHDPELPGIYMVTVDLSDLQQLPPRAKDFIVLLSLNFNSSQPGGGAGTTFTAFYDVLSMNVAEEELVVRVDVIDVQTSERNNAAFSMIVVEP